jgi:GTP pyrophosphokinase
LGLDTLAGRLGSPKLDEFLALVGRGEIGARQIQDALREESKAQPAQPGDAPLTPPISAPRPGQELTRRGDILIVGVDKLLTVLAKCCKPAPPDPIIGFVTRGRGVTVHRKQCPNVARLATERMIAAEWGTDSAQGRFPVDLEVAGTSHPSLMRDILDLFTREKVRVAAATSLARDLEARMFFTLEVSGLDQVRRLLGLLGELRSVTSARRR